MLNILSHKSAIPGLLLSLTIAIPAWFLGQKIPIVGGPVFGIAIGLLLATFRKPGVIFDTGIKFSINKVLKGAIILLGFQMNIRQIVLVGGQSLYIMIFTLLAAFLAAYIFSKIWHVESKMATLIGVGTAICGGSAIAATAPVIKANTEEIASSISTIFLFNIMAVFLFPMIGHAIGLSESGFGMWAGTAINDTSSVVAASFSFGENAGPLATIVKLTRTLMIIPITFLLAIYTTKKNKEENSKFSLGKVFPYFILGFIGASIVNTIGILEPLTSNFLGHSGKFLIVMAMASIGLSTDIRNLISRGKKSILLGAICWLVVALSSLIAQRALGFI